MCTDHRIDVVLRSREIAERIANGDAPPFLSAPLVAALVKRLAIANSNYRKLKRGEVRTDALYNLLIKISDVIAESQLHLPKDDAEKCIADIVRVLKQIRQELRTSNRGAMVGALNTQQVMSSGMTEDRQQDLS